MIGRLTIACILFLLAGCSTFTPDARMFWGSMVSNWPTCSDPCLTGACHDNSPGR